MKNNTAGYVGIYARGEDVRRFGATLMKREGRKVVPLHKVEEEIRNGNL